MTIFLISWPDEATTASGSAPEAGHLLEQQGIDLLAVWTRPDPLTDYLLVHAPSADELRAAAGGLVLPPGGITEITPEGSSERSDEQILDTLLEHGPARLHDVDAMGFAPTRLDWCDRCRTFHRPGRHAG